MQAAIEGLMYRACRPRHGPVAPSALAVIFDDPAEMLACLALDWLDGTLSANWWWRELLKGSSAEELLKREWIRAPDLVPASFEIVSFRGRAVELLQKLPESFLAPVLDRILQFHAVPRVGPLRHQEALMVGSPELWENQVDVPEPDESERLLAFVPEARDSRLPPKKLEWLIQVLMLRRAPVEVRTGVFQKGLQKWITHLVARPLAAAEQVVELPEPRELRLAGKGVTTLPLREETESAGSETAVVQERTIPNSPGEACNAGALPVSPGIAPPPLSSVSAPPAIEAAQALNEAPVAKITPHATMESTRRTENGVLQEEVTSGITPAASLETSVRSMERLAGIAPRIETAFGGVMFLLSVFLFLKLYGDFSCPLELGLELNIWDLLSMLGAKWCGPEFEDDPLSGVLATLAGHSKGDKPHFDPPSNWSMPPEWVEPFPEGFEWKGDASGDPMERWLSEIAAYIRARLSRAIGREDAAEFLCRIPAVLWINPAHVDVYFELNRYPVELRLAGLDRDPGWIPAAGRYVAFHFD